MAKTPETGADLESGGEKQAVQTMRATVARGRTVEIPVGDRKVVGSKEDGSPVYGPSRFRSYGPGEEVTLPVPEVRRLRELGTLVDPDKIAPPPAEGTQMYEHGTSR